MSHTGTPRAGRKSFLGRVFDWFRHDAPISKKLIVLWLCVAGFVWYDMARTDINILVWSLLFSLAGYLLVRSVELDKFVTKRGIGKYFIDKAEPLYRWRTVALAAFSVSVVTAWGYSALLSGDWPGVAKTLPSSYVGSIHVHHWMWAFTVAVLIRYVLVYGLSAKKKWSAICFVVAAFFLFLIGVSFITRGWFSNESAAWIAFGIVAAAVCSVGYALRRDVATSPWFFVFACIQLGIALGIFGEGFLGVLRSYSSLIVFK